MTHDPDTLLLAEALELDSGVLAPLSREPLGSGSVSGYTVTADDGQTAIAYLDTSGLTVREETGLAMGDEARVWIHPADPHLPAFLPTAFGHAAATVLERLGIGDTENIELIAYRPGRRAVIRAHTGQGTFWIKVVRPRRVERIVQLHRSLTDGGLPVPAVVGWSGEGLIVLEPAPGRVLTETDWTPEPLLDAVDDLRRRLGAAHTGVTARTSLLDRVPWYADRVARSLGEDADLADILAGIERLTASTPPAQHTIHGDLHLGQLFADDTGALVGLIDVDTAGSGDPADDSSAFIGHAIASAALTGAPDGAARLQSLGDVAAQRWSDDRTRGLTAVHLLGHALGAAEGGHRARALTLLDVARATVGAEA